MREPTETDQDRDEELSEKHVLELLDRYFVNDSAAGQSGNLAGALEKAGVDLERLGCVQELMETPWRSKLEARESLAQIHERMHEGARDGARISPQAQGAVLQGNGKARARQSSWQARAAIQNISHRTWLATAGIAAALVVTVTGWLNTSRGKETPLAEHPSVYTTANAQRATIKLPDESVVILNVGSRLEVPANYASGNRIVRLQGEALFTVQHHRGAPFTVIAGPSTTRVLGTSFIVRHYATDTVATVVVRDGKVAVGTRVLGAAQEATIAMTGVSRIGQYRAGAFSFANGVLTLTETPLPEAVAALNRWYDADIRLGDPSLASRKLDGGFRAGSLTDLVSILELTFNVRVAREGRVLTLYPRG